MGNIKKIVILVLILAVPGFLYYLLTAKGKNRYKPLAIYGPKVVANTFHKYHGKAIPDTIYHHIADFNLTDQDGQKVSLKTFEGKILIVSFFYTHCPTVCVQLNSNVDLLAHNYIKNKMLSFVSITVDPERDSASVLKKYAKQFELKTDKWRFLTGDTSTVYNLARKSFLVNALKAGKDDFIYSDKLILIDPVGRIRGYYEGTDSKEITKLNDEIKVQIAEELRKIKGAE
ncbi:SCO family protein [Mucilaginibacter paludis]|uniref:Electron transport protein SCO1/SenC n=1 Tax=Mucilaginibacter paludis DSM 18603 TaxID=714943 RepID=H1Y2J5_9SPHI|nr:SCO family protein [Mucilaginibacter paludis]EHQ28043.1 electron transport protein SCO1/SenC [Mucilaginibacter paludis DSM 18603]